MPFDWREFLVIAHELRNDSREGAQRTCLGRAYYYTFNLSLVEARMLNFSGQLPDLHKKLWAWCQRQANPEIKQIGNDGLRMRALRVNADYHDSPIVDLAFEVNRQLNRARSVESSWAKSKGQTPPATLP